MAKFSASLAAFIAGQDPDIAYQAADNAIENNAMVTGMLEGQEALALAECIKDYSDALAKDVATAISEATAYLKELPPEALKAMEKLTQWFEIHGEGAMLSIKEAQTLLKDAPVEILDAVTTWVKENPLITEMAVAGMFAIMERYAEDNGKERNDFLPMQRQIKQNAVFTVIKTWPKLIKNAIGKLGKTNKAKADVKGTPPAAGVQGASDIISNLSSNPSSLENPKNVIQYEKLKASLAQEEALGSIPVGSALKSDPQHSIANQAIHGIQHGQHFTIKGADGNYYNLTQVIGSFNNQQGIFEYIVDSGNKIKHQRFIPNGQITGYPNQKPTKKE